MTTATIEGIKTIPAIPRQGEQSLSVNLALVSLPEVVKVSAELGFTAELVQITYPVGSSEIHALLWTGSINEAATDMSQRIDALAKRMPTAAIRSVRGAWTQAS
jgi:putative effector of murein hydrolase LrgA (UPF0299 family)